MVFPWRSVDGTVVEQVRPATPVLNGDGRLSKYVWPKGQPPILNVLRRVTDPERVLIVEGTRQTHTALRYAPESWQVVGIGGCSTWTEDGVASGDLSVLCEDRDVVILFDADRERNLEVWSASKKLAEALDVMGAIVGPLRHRPGPR